MQRLANSMSKLIFLIPVFTLISNASDCHAQSYDIVQKKNLVYPIAGTGTASYTGDDGSSLYAGLNAPTGIAIDADGNLYIADSENHVIRRIEAETGIISTVAGTGEGGFSEETGIATEVQLNSPQFVSVAENGDFYISDTGNHRVRKVTESGIMSTVHKAPNLVPGQIAIDNLNGIVYFTDRYTERILRRRKDDFISSVMRIIPSGDAVTFLSDPGTNQNFQNDIDVDALGNVFLIYTYSGPEYYGSTTIARYNGKSGTQDSVFTHSSHNVQSFSLSKSNLFYATYAPFQSLGVFRYGEINDDSGFREIGTEKISTVTGKASDLAIDKEGNVIFADIEENKIYRITNSKGFEPDIEIPETFPMGEIVLGSSRTKFMQVSNIGNMTLSIQDISSQIPGLSVQPKSVHIESGDSASVTLTIKPESPGEITGTITVLNTDPDQSNVTIPLTATVFSSQIDLDLERGPENRNAQTLQGVTSGDSITVQIFGTDMPTLNGFQVSLQHDPTSINTNSFAFEAGELIPDALAVIAHAENAVTVGTATTGKGSFEKNSGLMGTLTFVVADNFSDSTSINLTTAIFSLSDGTMVEIERYSSITLSVESQLTGDFDGDSSVGFSDFVQFAQVFGKQSTDADYDSRFDLDSDGMVGFSDFLIFAASFGDSG